jgi:hypothetical protein
MNTKQRVSAQRGRASCRFGCKRAGCDRISLRRASLRRKIVTNNFGTREMSVTFLGCPDWAIVAPPTTRNPGNVG